MSKVTVRDVIALLNEDMVWNKAYVLDVIRQAREKDPKRGGPHFDYSAEYCHKISLRFECDDTTWVTLPADHPMLVPFYDCEPESIESVSPGVLAIWLKTQDFFPTYTRGEVSE